MASTKYYGTGRRRMLLRQLLFARSPAFIVKMAAISVSTIMQQSSSMTRNSPAAPVFSGRSQGSFVRRTT